MVRSNAQVELSIEKTLLELSKHIQITCAYLFGSYAYGTPHEYSDVDLAVFSPAAAEMDIDEKVCMIAEVGMAVRENVEIHVFDDRLLATATPADFAGFIMAKGRPVPVPQAIS